MKKVLCLAVLAMTLSTPAAANGYHTACHGIGLTAQADLRMAKMGMNNYERLANDPERIMSYGVESSVMFLVVSEAMWENRNTYNAAKAYKFGYDFCMTHLNQ